MNKITATGEPATELERLIAELSESGLLAFVFGVGWWTAHLTGATRPLFRGPADRRWSGSAGLLVPTQAVWWRRAVQQMVTEPLQDC